MLEFNLDTYLKNFHLEVDKLAQFIVYLHDREHYIAIVSLLNKVPLFLKNEVYRRVTLINENIVLKEDVLMLKDVNTKPDEILEIINYRNFKYFFESEHINIRILENPNIINEINKSLSANEAYLIYWLEKEMVDNWKISINEDNIDTLIDSIFTIISDNIKTKSPYFNLIIYGARKLKEVEIEKEEKRRLNNKILLTLSVLDNCQQYRKIEENKEELISILFQY